MTTGTFSSSVVGWTAIAKTDSLHFFLDKLEHTFYNLDKVQSFKGD
jgi:hypothetical protein